MQKTAAIMLADRFEELEVVTPFDLVQRGGVQVDLVSVQNKPVVTGTMGLKVSNTVNLKDYDFSSVDCLIIPGGAAYEILEKTPEVIEQIKAFAGNPDKILAAICAGSSILGNLGIYKGLNYTCVPGLNGDFGGHYELTHAVIDGHIVTGISVGGAFDFALDIIEKLMGKEAAEAVAKDTCYTL